jgi:hypothetical protein
VARFRAVESASGREEVALVWMLWADALWG